VIENVEELGAELDVEPALKMPVFGDGEVEFLKPESGNVLAPHVPN